MERFLTTNKDVSENTWRKSLNNLIYIYKTKGTRNAVRALLNVYGYPPNSLTIQEYGGDVQPTNGSMPVNFNPDSTNNIFDLGRSTSSLNFIEVPEYLPGICLSLCSPVLTLPPP